MWIYSAPNLSLLFYDMCVKSSSSGGATPAEATWVAQGVIRLPPPDAFVHYPELEKLVQNRKFYIVQISEYIDGNAKAKYILKVHIRLRVYLCI